MSTIKNKGFEVSDLKRISNSLYLDHLFGDFMTDVFNKDHETFTKEFFERYEVKKMTERKLIGINFNVLRDIPAGKNFSHEDFLKRLQNGQRNFPMSYFNSSGASYVFIVIKDEDLVYE